MSHYLDAWLRNDGGAVMDVWAGEVVHHVSGRHRLAGNFLGKQAFIDHYDRVLEELGWTIEVVEVHDVLVSDHHTVAFVKERAVRGEGARSSMVGEKGLESPTFRV